jgi:hypothetical protein
VAKAFATRFERQIFFRSRLVPLRPEKPAEIHASPSSRLDQPYQIIGKPFA